MFKERAYEIIEAEYKDKKAERTEVPYINHIKEGKIILEEIEATDEAHAAYYLHPLFQGAKELQKTYQQPWIEEVSPQVLLLAMEYRNKANRYLCAPNYDNLNCPSKIAFPLPEVKKMLIADKIQNRKDFHLYHQSTHNHSEALNQYFENWLKLLEVTTQQRDQLTKIISK